MAIQGAQTLNRSVISTVLYRLSYTTASTCNLTRSNTQRQRKLQLSRPHSLHRSHSDHLSLIGSICFGARYPHHQVDRAVLSLNVESWSGRQLHLVGRSVTPYTSCTSCPQLVAHVSVGCRGSMIESVIHRRKRAAKQSMSGEVPTSEEAVDASW